MKDLRQYSDNELSLQVFNDECLYDIRKDQHYLSCVIDETFLHTDEQMRILQEDLRDDIFGNY